MVVAAPEVFSEEQELFLQKNSLPGCFLVLLRSFRKWSETSYA